MGGSMELLAHWTRQVAAGSGEEADPWAVGDGGSIAAAAAAKAYRWVTIVDEVILSFTVLASMMVLGSMLLLEYRGRPATTRMRIVQSLIVSDLILGFVGIIGTSLVLSGSPLEHGTNACSGLGYSLVAVLWTEHLWTLTLALATYMILKYPLAPFTLWLERRWATLWLLVWVIGAAMALIGYMMFGYFPSGGLCYYGVNSGLYGELVQFIPRASVMLIITVLYARLFIFLRRPDRIRASFSESSNTGMFTSRRSRSRNPLRSTGISGILSRSRKESDNTDSSGKALAPEMTGKNFQSASIPLPQNGDTHSRSRSPSRSPQEGVTSGTTTPFALRQITPPPTPDEPAPWEQVQLPIFHIDGERFGGRDAAVGASAGRLSGSGLLREQSTVGMWSGWKGLGKTDEKKDKPKRVRSSTISTSSPPHAPRARFGSVSVAPRDLPASPKSVSTNAFPPTVEINLDSPNVEDTNSQMTPTQARYNAGDVWQALPNDHDDRRESATYSSSGGVARLRQPSTFSAFSYSVTEDTGPTEGPVMNESSSHAPEKSSYDGESGEKARSPPTRPSGLTSSPSYRTDRDVQNEAGEDEDEEDEFDLMRMLQGSGSVRGGTRTQGEDDVEFVEESMASYLNRKTALLMLWFPLGYVLLFSVSLVRIIYDFVGEPPVALRAVSRWFIFSQGILDALIYGLVEWHTKRAVRKRVRKGTFNTPSASRNRSGGVGTGSALGALRSIGQGSKGRFTSLINSQQMGVSSQTMSGGSIPISDRLRGQSLSKPSNRTPTTSFIPPIPEGLTIEEQIEGLEGDYEGEVLKSGAGTGSGYEVEEDSTRKASTVSEMGTVHEVVSESSEEDGRARERRKHA